MAATALPVLPFVEFPHLAVWPWIIASVIFHMGYKLALIRAYAAGDLAQTYPLARGSAPLLTTIGAIFLVVGDSRARFADRRHRAPVGGNAADVVSRPCRAVAADEPRAPSASRF